MSSACAGRASGGRAGRFAGSGGCSGWEFWQPRLAVTVFSAPNLKPVQMLIVPTEVDLQYLVDRTHF
jgi:hypothetical protein